MTRSEALCRILKTYRLDQGLTQQELADRLGVVQTLVSKVESRERRLDVVELIEYLKPLGRTVPELLDEVERLAPDDGRDLVASDTEQGSRLVVSGTGLNLARILGLLDRALSEAGESDVPAAELIVSLARSEGDLDELVVDLTRLRGPVHLSVVSTLREVGETR